MLETLGHIHASLPHPFSGDSQQACAHSWCAGSILPGPECETHGSVGQREKKRDTLHDLGASPTRLKGWSRSPEQGTSQTLNFIVQPSSVLGSSQFTPEIFFCVNKLHVHNRKKTVYYELRRYWMYAYLWNLSKKTFLWVERF